MKLLAFVALTLVCGTAAARDVGQIPANSDPKISTWFRTAKSPSGTACCDEADGYREGVPVKVAGGEPTVIFRSWWATSDGYHLSLVDPSDLRSLHLIWDGPVVRDNPTGGAVVWLSRENGIVLVRCTRPLTSEANGELPMHFRIYDLAADRCVWSIPPIDTVPVKLRGQKLVVRAIDNDGGVFEVASVDGVRLADLATQFLADRRVNRLNIHLAADDSYAGRMVRHHNQQALLDRTSRTFDRG